MADFKNTSIKNPFKKVVLKKLNDKLGNIIVSGQTTLVSQNYLTLWIISLALGISSFVILSLLPFSKHPSGFSLMPTLLTVATPWQTFSSSQVTSERVAAEFEEIQNMSKLKAAEKERKLFLRHALERRKNVSKQNKSAKFPTERETSRYKILMPECQSKKKWTKKKFQTRQHHKCLGTV